MEGGHRVEDDPVAPLNRLDSFYQQQQLEPPHRIPQDQWERLDHIARPSLDSSHNVSPQPKPDRLLDAPLKLPAVASSSHHPQSTHQTYFTHLVHQGHYGENFQTHHQPSVVSHALQPSPLPALKDQSSPATTHAGSGPPGHSSASNSSQSQPFPPFPSFDTFDPNELHDPGAFYRPYTDVSPRRHHRPHLDAAAALPAADQMAPEAPVSRSPLPASSFPPTDNTNGLPGQKLQHVQQQPRSRPPPSLTNRSNAIRSTRSVSSPVDNNSGSTASTSRTGYGTARSSSTSVKDLKKRFDQINGGQMNSAGSFSTSLSASSRIRPVAAIDLPSSPSLSSTTASRSRASTAGTSFTKGAATPSRARSPTGHSQLPPSLGSPKSFASRIAKPRVGVPATYSVPANEQASQSMSNLSLPLASPRAARMESPPPPPPMIRADSSLFGSVLPAYNSSLAIGDNIDAVIARPRRTSFESVLHSPSRIFPRSRSEMKQNSEAVLPTDWNSNTTSPHKAANHDAPAAQPTAASSSTSRLPTGHVRAHSDFADAKPVYRDRYLHRNSQHNFFNTLPPTQSHFLIRARLDGQQTANSSSHQPTFTSDMPQSPSSPTSRLPMSVRKLSTTSGRSSPSSTRSDSSVSAAERRSAAAIRVSRQQQPQAPPVSSANAKATSRRAATPTSTPAVRTKVSGATPTSSHRPPLSQTPGRNSRVSASNATPQPTPPPLRGSQTRQPALPATALSSSTSRYSEASLSSSATGRTRLPGPGNSRSSTNKQDEGRASRRKIDVGPIDFAQRRETIRLKYSKSIRDTEASAARQAAAERRKKELEAAAKAKALAEAAVRAQSETGRRAMGASAITLSSKSSASSLSAMSNAAAGATTTPALAAVARSVSVRSSTEPNAANMDDTAVSLPSPTTSTLPDNSTTPQPPTVAAGAAGACAAVSSSPQSSAHQALQPSLGLVRKTSLQNAVLKPSALTLSMPAPEPKPDCEWVPQDGDSPTLGLSGTYPSGLNSPPPIEIEELLPPAVSLNTVTTMPDKDLQTDPPRQDVTADLQGGEHPQQSKQQEEQQQLQEQAQSEYSGFVHDGHQPSVDLTTSEAAPVHPSHQDAHSDSKVQDTFLNQDRGPADVAITANSEDLGQSRDASPSPFEQHLPGSHRQDSFESRPQTPPQEQTVSHEPEPFSAVLNQTPRPKRELRHISSYQHIKRSANEDVATDLRVGASTLYGPDNMDINDAAIGIAVSSIYPSVEDNHSELARRNVEPEYEVQPFRTDDRDVKTTVTILGRETDVPSRQSSLSRLTKSSGRRGVANESGSDNGEVLYDAWIRDNTATLPDPTFSASGQSDEPLQTERSARLPHRTPHMSNGLNLPSIMSPANRLSQQSGWTDFSIESEDARAFLALRAATATLPHEDSSIDHNATLRARVSPLSHLQNRQIMQQRGRRRDPYDSNSRPTWTDEEKEQARQDDSFAGVYVGDPPDGESILRSGKESVSTMLPPLDTDTEFFIPYLTDDNVTGPHIPVLPDHDPPPIPASFDGRDSLTENDIRPSSSSAYYDSSRPNSFALGMRDDQDGQDSFTFGDTGSADDSMPTSPPPTMAIQSSEQALFEPPMQSISGVTLINSERPSGLDGAADACDDDAPHSQPSGSSEKTGGKKEQSRLVQRQMVIRELIDTESVFVRDMNIVEEIYKGTAEACPQLDGNTVKLIFRNTDEIIAFHTAFLVQLKDAVSSVYVPKGGRRSSPLLREDSTRSDSGTLNSVSAESITETTISSSSTAAATTTASISEDARDRQTCLGPAFHQNIDQMRITHEAFLRSSDSAAKRLIQIQEDPTVKLWLTECNEVAQDLTAAWNLDSLLIKPMQRITKYPNLISQLLQYTPEDHPDRPSLISARTTLENAILEINKTKKNFELVGQIVGRKRKDSDVRAGFARAFGKRVDKLQVSSNRTPEDRVYAKLNEKFADDYLRLQVVLRDVEFYTRQVSAYVHEFLQLLSAMELVMRLQPSPYPELESKWASFNVSMRDMEKVALEQHLARVRKQVIEPFEMVIKCYGNPSLAMKKRAKRRLDYERAAQLKKSGKKIDKQLAELVEQYDALNEALKKELPMLSANTEKIGNICLGNFVEIQVQWFAIWKEKVKVVLEDQQSVPEVGDILSCFARDFKDVEEYVKQSLTFLTKGAKSMDLGSPPPGGIGMLRTRSGRPSDTISPRTRRESVNSDSVPTLPAPDFGGRSSGHFTFSSTTSVTPPDAGTGLGLGASASFASATIVSSPQQIYHRDDNYGSLSPNNGSLRGSSRSSIAPETTAEPASVRSNCSANTSSSGFYAGMNASGRPSTGRSHESSGNTAPRPSFDSLAQGLPAVGQPSMAAVLQASQREPASTHNTVNQLPPSNTASGDSSSLTGSFGSGGRRPSVKLDDNLTSTKDTFARGEHGGVSQDSLPAENASQLVSRASSRERVGTTFSYASSTTSANANASKYKVLWLAASLFEFNIETKHEAGYPYLTYQEGEIFDVIAEKGELWLAKNQDDPDELLGWIWSKHFAKLADS